MSEKFLVVFVTTSSEDEAKKISDTLVGERLAACCNIISPIRSIYRWKGEINDDKEALIIIKTKEVAFEKLAKRIRELHSYEVSEVIALPIVMPAQEDPYLNWIYKEVE